MSVVNARLSAIRGSRAHEQVEGRAIAVQGAECGRPFPAPCVVALSCGTARELFL
jgi:hypothetical protein